MGTPHLRNLDIEVLTAVVPASMLADYWDAMVEAETWHQAFKAKVIAHTEQMRREGRL